MHLGIVSEASTRKSSIDLSYSDINPSQFDTDMDFIQDPIETTPQTDPEALTESERDPIFFCENVMLKAEDRVFSVPKSGLIEHGTYFQSLLDQHTNPSFYIVGNSEKHPIVLDGVSKIHFHNLLRLIYPFRGIDPPSGDEHWLGILDLSTKWGFREIREMALTHLDHIFTSPSHYRDPVRALYLCKKYDIHQHINHQYETLITSVTPLDRLAMLAGGIDEDTFLQLMLLRERWLCGMVWGKKGTKTGFGGLLPCRLSARKIVADQFSCFNPTEPDDGLEDTESLWRRDESVRLSDHVKRLEEMEKALIEAERLTAEAAEEANKKAEEEAEKRRVAEDHSASKMESEATESRLPSGVDVLESKAEEITTLGEVDDLDDMGYITGDTSVGDRLERLILLHADNHELLKWMLELKATGIQDDNIRMKQLKILLQKSERKIRKYWEYGVQRQQASYDSADSEIIILDQKWAKSTQRIQEKLERLLGPGAQSLVFGTQTQKKSPSKSSQRRVVADISQRYGFLPYSNQDSCNPSLSRTNIPDERFGEWLVEFRRLVQLRKASANL